VEILQSFDDRTEVVLGQDFLLDDSVRASHLRDGGC